MKILSILIEHYPGAMEKPEIALAAGYTPGTGTFNTYLGSLRGLGLIEYPRQGAAAATNLLFPEGL